MDQNRVKGTAKQAAGSVKEAVGKAVGNPTLQAKGKLQQAEGSVQKAFGKARDTLRKG
jgi:uncharacterized protein YjbJ (UPF0337 family)